MKIKILKDSKKLEEFILKNSHKDSYQYFKLKKWRNFISNYYRFHCYNLSVEDGENIVAYFPVFLIKSKIFKNHFVSMPFAGHGGGVVVKKGANRKKILELFVKELKRIAKKEKVIYFQLRGPRENEIDDLLSVGFKEPLIDFNFFLDLKKGPEEIRKKMNKKLRNRIKKSEMEGVEVHEENTKIGVNKLFKLYLKTMKRLGSPPESKEFFLTLLEMNDFKIYLATYNGKVIAASSFLLFSNYSTWYTGVSDTKYRNFNGTSLILWEFIKTNHKVLDSLDLGVSREGSSNYTYKKKWNPKIVKASKLYFYFDKSKSKEVVDVRNKKYSLFSSIWKKFVPSFVAQSFGPLIRKNMGS